MNRYRRASLSAHKSTTILKILSILSKYSLVATVPRQVPSMDAAVARIGLRA
ncbi:MAG: hypothetical protein NTV49_13500 [Kiritimatiellaeota bacterium]|nr:hypothetical protein [Kiritimatiellota bacterium]